MKPMVRTARPASGHFFALVAGVSLLAACGGGGSGDPEATGGSGGDGGGGSGGLGATLYAVEGTVSGLAGTGLVLQLNDRHDLPIAADGPFAFPAVLEFGDRYTVGVAVQPTHLSQTCTVDRETGTVGTGTGTAVVVTCVTGTFDVGVEVQGLEGEGLKLALNDGPNLSIDADGVYTFPAPLVDGSTYAVTVSNPPTNPSQTCAVADATARLDGADVSLAVTCATDTFTVGGTVGGLRGRVLLRLNGGDDLELTHDGAFTFPTPLPDTSSYRVEVSAQPEEPLQRCVVAHGEGQLAGADVSAVRITCTNLHTLGGTVTGLAGAGLVLKLDDTQELPIAADGPFVFPSPLEVGTDYHVTVGTQPDDQVCKVTGGTGRVYGDYTGVSVSCATLYSISGTVGGLVGTLGLRAAPGNEVTVRANGSFTFPQQLPAGTAFNVQVATRPAGQVCTIAGGQGTLTADYGGVVVTCAEETFAVGVLVSNLWNTAGSLVLTLNGTQNLPIHANGVHTFPNGLVHGAAYDVQVTSQPSYDEYCYVTGGSGTIDHAPASGIMVDCYWWY